ncbi:MAG TPA: extracellular solute-binding protein [Firmicutes bacterium]|nr:extracellular solute-binding protein [Bacillota bacterium]
MLSKETRLMVCSILLPLCILALVDVTLAEAVKITFMFRGGELQAKTVEMWKAEFEAENPDIIVEWQVAAGDWMTKLPVMVATGVGPDVFESWGVNGRNWGLTGVSLDVAPYVARDFTPEDIADFYPPAWRAAEFTSGPGKGVRYGLPSNGNVFMMYYNKDMLAEAAVPDLPILDRQGDWTWESLILYGKKLTRRDADGRVIRWMLDSDDLYAPTNRGAGWLFAAGGHYFNPNDPMEFIGNKPAAVTALSFMQDLIWRHELMSPLPTRGQARWNLGNSVICMWQGSANLGTFEATVNAFEWDLGPKPMGPEGRGYVISPDMFAINAQSQHKEEAWRFLKYLTSKAGQEVYTKVMGRSPTRRSAYPLYEALYPNRSTIYTTIGMMEGTPIPEAFMSMEINSLIVSTIRNEIATNKKHPQQAMDEIADAIKAMLTESDQL